MTALARRGGSSARRDSDGRVHVPPLEYDPVTHAPLTDFVEVSPVGTVVTWTWTARPLDGQPLDRPFGWALIRLDGADTADAARRRRRLGRPDAHRACGCGSGGPPNRSATSATSSASSRATTPATPRPAAGERRRASRSPMHHHADPPALPAHGLARGEPLPARRWPRAGCSGSAARPAARSTSRRAAPARPTACPPTDEVELPDRGTVTTFCVVNVPFAGQRVEPPYVVGAGPPRRRRHPDLQHLILGCPADEVRMGMRVAAVWQTARAVEHHAGEHRPLPADRRAGRALRVLRAPPVRT